MPSVAVLNPPLVANAGSKGDEDLLPRPSRTLVVLQAIPTGAFYPLMNNRVLSSLMPTAAQNARMR